MKTQAFFLLFLFSLILGGCGRSVPFVVEERGVELGHGFYEGVFSRLDKRLKTESKARLIPSFSMTIERGGEVVYTSSYGTTLPGLYGEPVSSRTFFDSASIAKPMSGAILALLLMESSCLNSSQKMELRSCLNHTTGWEDGSAQVPRPLPQGNFHYANLNYFIIHQQAMRCLKDPYGHVVRDYWMPMGLRYTTFDPPSGSPIVYSGYGRDGNALLGVPYDPLAAKLQADRELPLAHSGLFTTSRDLATFGSQLMISQDTPVKKLRHLLLSKPVSLSINDDAGSLWVSDGGMISADKRPFAAAGTIPGQVYYSSGYTGCLLWVDRKTGTSVALLSNASAVGEREQWKVFFSDLIEIVIDGTERGYTWVPNQ